MTTTGKTKLLRMSRVKPKRDDFYEMNSVVSEIKNFGDRRAFDILMEAQHYWNQMDRFRRERERNKRYTYGDQWGDIISVNGQNMTEGEYITSQGSVPLKNNLIRRLARAVLSAYRSQNKEPTCVARDRAEQKAGEEMSTLLQYNMQVNRMNEVSARTMEDFIIGGFVMHRKSYGWRNDRLDCWTDYVNPNNLFIDNNMRDFRGWDVTCIGEIHDISFGQLCEQFAVTPEDYKRLRDIYRYASRRDYVSSYAEQFGYSRLHNYDFLLTTEPGRCRVIEVWRKEQKPRYRCHDYQDGSVFKVDEKDYQSVVVAENERRLAMAKDVGLPEEEVPLIQAQWFMDNYWYFYYLTPFGHILQEGETPYNHKSHPYVFKAYPFIDGEVHSFVSDVIDQQRYVNRLITLYDWIMRASAKGVLLMPEDSVPAGKSMEDIAESWAEFNGVIVFKPSTSGALPKQVANNCTNIGISELLNLQLKLLEEISGVHGALQGKPGYSGQSAAMYAQQAQNASTMLLDLLESYSSFVIDGAYKDVKNIQQFYDSKRIFNISGSNDSAMLKDIEFDLSITESTTTPAYRQFTNDMLIQLWQAQAITVEQLLENGSFPFADKLLQSIRSQKEQLDQGQVPDNISPEIMQEVQRGANVQAMNQLEAALRG